MSHHRPAPPRTQHRPSRRTVERAAPSQPLGESWPSLLRALGIGLLSAVLLCTVGSVIATALLLTLPDPTSPLPAVATAILLLGSLIGAAVSGKLCGGRVLLCGLGMGALLLILMFLSTSLLGQTKSLYTPTATYLLRGAVALFSLLGAYLGARMPTRRARRRR